MIKTEFTSVWNKNKVVFNMLDNCFLRKIRNDAYRKRVWYKVLDQTERGIMNLTVQIVDNVQNSLLAKVLLPIISKLKSALKSPFMRHIEGYGVQRVQTLVEIAESWGNKSFSNLRNSRFARFLALMNYNNPAGW